MVLWYYVCSSLVIGAPADQQGVIVMSGILEIPPRRGAEASLMDLRGEVG